MSYRNSLNNCIDMLGKMFASGNYPHLSILQVPGGKYYKVMTDADLDASQHNPNEQNCRLVFRGTLRELAIFSKSRPQTIDIFAEREQQQCKPSNTSEPPL